MPNNLRFSTYCFNVDTCIYRSEYKNVHVEYCISQITGHIEDRSITFHWHNWYFQHWTIMYLYTCIYCWRMYFVPRYIVSYVATFVVRSQSCWLVPETPFIPIHSIFPFRNSTQENIFKNHFIYNFLWLSFV